MRQVVLLSGHICTGKSGLARSLKEEFGYEVIKSSEILRTEATKRSAPDDRSSLQRLGDELDSETGHEWLLREVERKTSQLPSQTPIVIDNVRTPGQLRSLRKRFGAAVVHIHLYGSAEELRKRYEQNCSSHDQRSLRYEEADLVKSPEDIQEFKSDADIRINTDRTDTHDTLVRVAARLGLYSPPNRRYVDLIIGGQFGSEGKGHVAAYLAREYDVLVRVGGPNAGHTVSSESGVYTYHQLPSGARDTDALLLLGPGMTINVQELLKEISECEVSPQRLFIDPQAMIIEAADIQAEKGLVASIASTGRGGGAAAARRIMRGKMGGVRLARDVEDLRPYVGVTEPYWGSTVSQLEKAYREGKSILVEGTQGSGLSLYHGQYPHVTSRDTNAAGCLAEAGISPSRVRRILMVIRTTPIRVGNPDGSSYSRTPSDVVPDRVMDAADTPHSGRLKHETSFAVIAREAGLDRKTVRRNEKTSTTKRDRRVGWFEWDQFRHACAINAPTDIVLTFADYIDAKNQDARRFEQLTSETINFIEELERVAQAPVSLINTRFLRGDEGGFDLRTVVDRRNWRGGRRPA